MSEEALRASDPSSSRVQGARWSVSASRSEIVGWAATRYRWMSGAEGLRSSSSLARPCGLADRGRIACEALQEIVDGLFEPGEVVVGAGEQHRAFERADHHLRR